MHRSVKEIATNERMTASSYSVRVVVLDNLREGVLKPDIYEPTLNALYREVLAPRVLYRETHTLLDELARASLDGTRKHSWTHW